MRKLFSLLLFIALTILAQSQARIGVFGGVSNYLGDLTHNIYKNSGPAIGLTLSYPITNRISIRGGFTYGKVKGADSLNPRQDFKLRNLSFQSSISEFSLVGEINTFDMSYKRWSPYVFGGLAVYHFNPYTFDQQNNKVFLQPLGTEGQGIAGYPNRPYSLTQLALPFGGGIKFDISENVRIALEVGLRKLFTDYLDDVSGQYADPNDLFAARGQQAVDISYRGDEVGGNLNYPSKGFDRGSPKYKDFYYFSGIHLSFQLPGGDNSEMPYSRKMGKNKRYGCPTVF